MAHSKGWKLKGKEEQEEKFQRVEMRMARMDLSRAIEWVDAKDRTWALTYVRRALKMLETAEAL